MTTGREFSSEEYWQQRYSRGGNSGAGSYGRLAIQKAEFLNKFVEDNYIKSVVEFGFGDGNQAKLFEFPQYTGYDVSQSCVDQSRSLFESRPNFEFFHISDLGVVGRKDLALSLDVIYHLVEDDVFETYINRLFFSATKFVIVYSSDVEQAWNSPHVRHRNFSRFVRERLPDWSKVAVIPNAYPFSAKSPEDTSFCDFHLFSCVDSKYILRSRKNT